MVKEFHPDHGGDPQLFELITHAFNVLYNDESRTAYDHAFKISKEAESDFNDMRTAAQEYLQAQDAKVDAQRKFFCHSLKQQYPNLTKEELEKMVDDKIKEQSSIEFELANAELDKKHGYKRIKDKETGIDPKELMERLKNLEQLREQESIEYEKERIFDEGEQFNPNKFNEAWDKMYGAGPMDMVIHDGNPAPFDGTNFSNFQSLNETNLYREEGEINNDKFGSIQFGKQGKNLTKDEVKKMTGTYDAYNHTAGADTAEYKTKLEELIKQREIETCGFNDMKMEDFVKDDTLGGYGLSYQIDFNGDNINWDNEQIRTKYKALIEYRKQHDVEISEDIINQMRLKDTIRNEKQNNSTNTDKLQPNKIKKTKEKSNKKHKKNLPSV